VHGLVAKKAKPKRLLISKKGPQHQNHVKMNVHILGDVMAVQRRNDRKVVNRTRAKAQHEWDKLAIIVKNVHHYQNQLWSN
jgi:hypothetical protein